MFNKTWAALLGALAMLAHGLLTDDGRLSTYDVVAFLVQGITVALVWYNQNTAPGGGNYLAKFVAAAWTAAGAILLPAFSDGIVTGEEWQKVAVAAATAVLVLLIPNRPGPTDRVPTTLDEVRAA